MQSGSRLFRQDQTITTTKQSDHSNSILNYVRQSQISAEDTNDSKKGSYVVDSEGLDKIGLKSPNPFQALNQLKNLNLRVKHAQILSSGKNPIISTHHVDGANSKSSRKVSPQTSETSGIVAGHGKVGTVMPVSIDTVS